MVIAFKFNNIIIKKQFTLIAFRNDAQNDVYCHILVNKYHLRVILLVYC